MRRCPGKFRVGNVGASHGEEVDGAERAEKVWSNFVLAVCVACSIIVGDVTCPDCAEERELGDMSPCWKRVARSR